jgi:hypothetical protein
MARGTSNIRTKATVCIVESLNFFDEDTRKEGEIISRTLRLSGKRTHYSYLRTKEEFEAFLDEFGQSSHRYLHISCHGNVGQFFLTTACIAAADFAKLLRPHAKKRRVFLSTCLATDSQFASALLTGSECRSVLGPVGEIDVDDAAIFWTSFYHIMFKKTPSAMTHADIEAAVTTCATLIGKKFRFFFMEDGELQERVLPRPNTKAK